MIIEFFGLPGAGKSTIARELAKDGDFRIIKIMKKSELIYFNFRYFFSHPIRFFKLFILVLRNAKSCQEFYYKFMNCFLDYNAKFQKAKKHKQAILDQGYFQNVISLFSYELSVENLKEFMAAIMLPDRLFIIDLDSVKRKERLERRGHGVRKNFSNKEKEYFLNLAERNFIFFIENYKNTFESAALIKSDDEPREVSKDIKKFL